MKPREFTITMQSIMFRNYVVSGNRLSGAYLKIANKMAIVYYIYYSQ